MRKRAWLLGAAVVVAAALVVTMRYILRPPRLGPLEASPSATQVSVRVGERLRFTATAPGATGFTWLRWGRPVSFDPTWSYVPTPEDAGWQQVTVEVTGRRGLHLARTWDVGVVTPVAPEIESLEPPAGFLSLPAGERWTFRARAHLPAAREDDRLAFEWLLDDRPVLREERGADDGSSELVLPPAGPGGHRLRLRVTEDGRTASLADWAIEVAAGAPVAIARVPSPPAAAPSTTTTLPPAAASPAAPALVRMPGPRILEAQLGEPIRLETHVEPASVAADASYHWTVDGKPVAESSGRLEFAPSAPGPHVLEVTVGAGGRTLGRDSWVVTALAPEPPTPARAEPPRRIVRLPAAAEVPGDVTTALAFEVRVEPPPSADAVYRWSVDGKTIVRRGESRLEYKPDTPGRHRLVVAVESAGATLGRATWIVAARTEEHAAPPAPAAPPPPAVAAAPAARSATALAEADVRRWLDDYARAWSQKDLGALRRMGQVRSATEAAQLERYFGSIDSLDVEVHVIALTVDGERASVEFERTDTVTDPSGRRQQLRLPPMRKEIERTPEGLRFSGRGGAG